jgi:hypothetical protein
MSFYEDASLVMIPSGYKSGKIYSQKPLSTDGQLTFTRASEATRVASNGLIEKVRTNEVLQSQTFDDASWGKSLVTITANFDTAPNGTLTADRFVSAGGAFPQISQARTVVSGTQYTASLYVKSDGTAQIPQVFIVTGNTLSFTPTSTWQRISITFTAASSSISLVIATNSAVAAASSFVIWGVQLETGDIATDYIPTTTTAVSVGPVANIPRLDYLNSTCPKLLLEPQRTNLMTFSEQFNNAAYTKTNVSVTSNSIVSPDGNASADFIIPSVTNGIHSASLASAAVSSGTHTLSVFAKKGLYKNLLVWFDGHSGGIGVNLDTLAIFRNTNNSGFKIENYGNGWIRISVTCTVSISSPPNFYIYDNSATPVISWAGNGTDGLYLWGAQLEAGAYATSYIPTLATSQTRVADAASKAGISSLIGQTEGVVFVNFNNRLLASYPNEYIVQIISGTTQLWLRKELAGNSFTARLIVSGSTIWTFASSILPINGNNKIAIAYKTGDSAVFLNGAQVSSTNTSAFSGSAFADLNFNFGGTLNPELPLSQALLFKTRLTNAQLAELTTL